MDRGPAASRITAVLGPTNTGKTHFAMERMLAHQSGMIGFPLRLLARENYDKAVRVKGEHAVALVTGEEKIVPPNASFFLCTVEAMPSALMVEFLAVDEVQLAADAERGHVFTERLMYARGRAETMFIGAETIRRLLRQLVPEAEIVTRPRFSRLTYAGPKRLTRLPARSAVIGFSATEVYSLAEMMRRRRGGTAVVLGALSPRTRNAQVEMYQAGEVDYLVATDAIGMGLNMDIGHVAFSRLTKFDGRRTRALSYAEVAQIAGRAGRHMSDGTFGTTAGLDPFGPELVEAVEGHEFPPIKQIYWRNADLDFESPAALLRSLSEGPPAPHLIPAREAEDFRVLAALALQAPIKERAATPKAVRLLWDVCRIPDFRKILGDAHVRLTGRIYGDLTSPAGRIDTDWIARQVDRIDRTTGDIGTLVGRIADIRTWTYVSHHDDWLDDAAHWQKRTRAIEDKLSDALHERLTQRFVDRRAAVLVRRMRDSGDLSGAVAEDGEVIVEGHFVGRLEGFRFIPDGGSGGEGARALQSAAARALRPAMAERVREFEAAPHGALALDRDGHIRWRDEPAGRLIAGRHIFAPEVEPVAGDLLGPDLRSRVKARLADWLVAHLRRRLGVLFAAQEATLSGAGRGLVFQLAESLGSVPRRQVAEQVAALTKSERQTLAAHGVRLGQFGVYLPALLKPKAAELRALLWSVHCARPAPVLPWGRNSLSLDGEVPDALLWACGYRTAGTLAVRIDRLEALARAARKLAKQGPFGPTPALRDIVGCGTKDFPAVMAALGFRWTEDEAGGRFERRSAKRKAPRRRAGGSPGSAAEPNPCSPFAVLKQLTIRE